MQRTCARLLFSTLLLSSSVGFAAWAEETPYCEKVRARASSDAALLFAPTLQAQGIKFPNNGTTDSGVTTGAGYQFRASLTLSLLDIWRGVRVLRVGEADCKQHEAAIDLEQLLAHGDDIGRLPALERRAAFLRGRRSAWEQLVKLAEERFAAKVTSLLELQDLRGRAATLDRTLAQVEGEIERLEARGLTLTTQGTSALLEKLERGAMRFERAVSSVRTLDAWTLSVAGGLIPTQAELDYYGIVQASFNFGGIVRYAREARYLRARDTELKTARYELRDRVARFIVQTRSASAQAQHELVVVNRQLGFIHTAMAALEQADSPHVLQALATVGLDEIAVESDRIYLAALVEALSHAEENDRGR